MSLSRLPRSDPPAHQLRGGKLTLFDGGMRVNAWVHSPLIPAAQRGRRETGLMHITDIIPTFVGAYECRAPAGRARPLHG